MKPKKAERTPTSDARFRQILARYQDVRALRDKPDEESYKTKEARAITLLEVSVIEWLNDVLKS